MTENFLHYAWKFKQFDFQNLQTTQGDSVQIVAIGEHNHNAGPDFLNARIKIGETLWAGNVEIHIKSSHWQQHNHSADAAYENTILHVVYDADCQVRHTDGSLIPCLEIKQYLNQGVYGKYLDLLASQTWIPCGKRFAEIDDFVFKSWLDRLLIERIERKTAVIFDSLERNQNNWETTFYQVLARGFGAKVNGDAFEKLAVSLPLNVLAKHQNDLFQIEALLFGQAGFLAETFEDLYPNRLQKEYQFLRKKYGLQPLNKVEWKFSRLRPANFPTVRIAQFAQLIFQSKKLFSKTLESENLQSLEKLFRLQPSEYWQEHYNFKKASALKEKSLGKSAIHLLVINTTVPILFLYSKQKGLPDFRDRSLELLDQLPAEKNSITEGWKNMGVEVKNAATTQALLQLKNEYCNQKRCLQCAVGHKLLR